MADSRLRVFDYVDQLNVILDRATKVPLSTRVVVDKQEVKQILQRVESSIDPDIRTAKDIIQQYDELIQKANRQAEQVTSEANEAARRAVDDANARAQTALQEAQARATDISRDAADKANAMVADAQARAAAMIADAQARAEQLVADSTITQRANAEAAQLLQRTHMDCDQYRLNTENSIQQTLERADGMLSAQLDQLRRLRQSFDSRQSDMVEEL
ncbi:MAG: hypothetical protein IJJ80_00435 [Clostridia bacterium]|nr:hypothetical protein [Clostridia bacterium]MBQ6231954.1 hypothetical protein [Clostridia bacterium]